MRGPCIVVEPQEPLLEPLGHQLRLQPDVAVSRGDAPLVDVLLFGRREVREWFAFCSITRVLGFLGFASRREAHRFALKHHDAEDLVAQLIHDLKSARALAVARGVEQAITRSEVEELPSSPFQLDE